MPVLNNYRLQFPSKTGKETMLLPYISTGLRLIAVVLILPCIKVSLYFLLPIGVLVALSFLTDFLYKRKSYTDEYSVGQEMITHKRIYFDETQKVMAEIRCKDIESVKMEESGIEGVYRLTLCVSGKTYTLQSDAYMYAMIEKRRENDLF